MSLIRRDLYRFDDFELDLSRRSLLRGGEKVALAPKTFEVLVCLVVRSGEVVLKEDLFKAVWPGSFVEESNLTQHIFWIRKALGDKAEYVVTIPGRGYEFTAPVQIGTVAESGARRATESFPTQDLEVKFRQSTELTHIVVEETTPIAAPARGAFRGRWRLVFTIAAAAALLSVAAWGSWRWVHRPVPGDHYQVVLADLVNNTGDPDFDLALKTLLSIDLNQSPFLVVATESDVRKTLKLMNRSPDSDVPLGVAREVCERLNDQVVLSGLIARFGESYLVTLRASDCSDGKDLVQVKATAKSRDGVIAAVDAVAANMRKQLGEPLRTLPRPSQTLANAHTFSLDALKAFSQGRAYHQQGKFKQAAEFYQRAIDLDPKFFSAWASLANCYNNLGEQSLGVEANAKAYDLRDEAEGPEKLRIVTMYEFWKTGDRYRAIRSYKTWTELYPRQTYPWVLLGEFEQSVGQLGPSIDAEKHAVALDPNYLTAYISLAENELFDGRLDEAKATSREAMARGFDSADFHEVLLDVAYIRHDAAGFQEQMTWYHEKASEEERDEADANLDISQGKVHAAVTLWLHEADLQKQDGRLQAMQEGLATVTDIEADLGLMQDARKHLKQFDPLPAMNGEGWGNIILAAAQVGDIGTAEKVLHIMDEKGKEDSDVQELFAPEGRAAIAIARGKPEQAIAAMQASLAYESAFPDVSDMRARAYLAAKQPEMAEREYRVMIDRPFVATISANVPMAHLGVARALEMQGRHDAARQEYEALFTLWKDADRDLPVLKQARLEYSHLPK